MEKFQGKYRIPSSRWQNWDYGSNAAYYVTICTRYHACYFGNIVLSPEKTMQYSPLGSIAYQYWTEIPKHFPFVELDAFVIMPNHVHGIVVINKPGGENTDDSETPGYGETHVETRLIASLQSSQQSLSVQHGGITGIHNPMIHDNLSRIIRWYKGRCSFDIHKIAHDFFWQSRFHDHIIRDYHEYEAIRDYILRNIQNWKEDSPLGDDIIN
ncbi:MAG: hypothetical protein JW798_16210 [Prolixibacteraceae bacterium]|nr:hypothetical protein [Prolixibacteraceae bacterium]